MGYTHYFYTFGDYDIAKYDWRMLRSNCGVIQDYLYENYRLDCSYKYSDDNTIWLNGRNDDQYEDFIFNRYEASNNKTINLHPFANGDARVISDSCKTNKNDYDIAVCLTLMLIRNFCANIGVDKTSEAGKDVYKIPFHEDQGRSIFEYRSDGFGKSTFGDYYIEDNWVEAIKIYLKLGLLPNPRRGMTVELADSLNKTAKQITKKLADSIKNKNRNNSFKSDW